MKEYQRRTCIQGRKWLKIPVWVHPDTAPWERCHLGGALGIFGKCNDHRFPQTLPALPGAVSVCGPPVSRILACNCRCQVMAEGIFVPLEHMMKRSIITCVSALAMAAGQAADCVTYEGKEGPGRGQHIVFLSGDEEYRSEEALPMLAKILAVRHGFKCTVLFAVNPADHTITPTVLTNIPGIEALDSADLCFMFLRFRDLPDEQMKHFADYLESGKPFIAIRTSTHAFAYERNKQSPYAKFDWRSKEWPGGFGQQVLGETWVNHWGNHGHESTRGVINDAQKDNPILRGVRDVWGPTDVYEVAHLPSDATVLLYGQVLADMKPGDAPVQGRKNNPMMPLVWIRNHARAEGNKVLTSTIGAAVDLENEDLRRLFVNGCYWAVGLEDKIAAKADVTYVGNYRPLWFGFGKFKPGVKPSDLELK